MNKALEGALENLDNIECVLERVSLDSTQADIAAILKHCGNTLNSVINDIETMACGQE